MGRAGCVMLAVVAAGLAGDAGRASGAEVNREQAAQALRRAVEFYTTQVSTEGSYLWRYSDDLKLREGEGKATATLAWVQPPGTPSVGLAYLEAWQLTGEAYLREAARATAHALVKGQLRSGGWDYRIEFDPQQRARYAYRVDSPAEAGKKQANVTTLDDNTTQSALRFLILMDEALEQKDDAIHESSMYALDALLQAQYPNGAWPQRYAEFPDPTDYPVKRASYPEEWSWTFPKEDYRDYYTFNDNAMADAIDVMLLAADVYGEERYRKAAEKCGDFILLAQLPDPQPAWAQQYDRDMHPAWARKFEPPSVTGGESQGVLRMLLVLYRHTGNEKYLEPIPRALAYLKKSQLPSGKLARFYELKTNKPLYFTKDYELTHSDDYLLDHYAMTVDSRLDRIEREYQQLREAGREAVLRAKARAAERPRVSKPRLTDALARDAARAVESLDERGAWVERGRLRTADAEAQSGRVIESRKFIENVRSLSRFIGAAD